jgi:4-hydroxybenzoate polyprenyltransferase
MSRLRTLGEYIKLARLHSSVLTGLTPLFGALAMNPDLDIFVIIEIFLIGILVHIFGFVLNEYFDLEVDRRSKELSDKPLVSGSITPKSALWFGIIALILSYIFLFLTLGGEFNLLPILFLSLTFGIFYAYDRWGKELIYADALLAGFVGFLCIMGASVVGWPLNELAILITSLAFLQLFLQNALAGMKDVEHDSAAGAKTTAIRLGVRVNADTAKFSIPSKFKYYIYSVKIFHIVIIYGFLYLYSSWDDLQISTITIVVVLMMIILSKIFSMKRFERERLIRLIGAHEIVTYAIIPLLFINILGLLTIILLLIFPVVWLACFMILMYGRLMPKI